MALAMFMNWPGVTTTQYETVIRELDLDRYPADGALLHVASFTPDGLRVMDVWESTEEFDAFNATRLTAAVNAAGIETEPTIEVLFVHNLFAPRLDVLSEIASTSLPDGVEAGDNGALETEADEVPAS